MRKGFTIVELLMVIGIIGVLAGIITTAASESMKATRRRRADALFALVQSGIATYYAQHDKWPDFNPPSKGNHRRPGSDEVDENQYDLTDDEVRRCIKEVIMSVKTKNPLIDVSGLWVSRSKGDRSDGEGVGMDFMTAIRGSRKNTQKMTLSDMYFGYPNESNGKFVRFGIGYSIATDQMTVGYRKDYLGNKKE